MLKRIHGISPPKVLIGAGPPCDTCVMILAGPPAVAMTYVKPSKGLDPSLYGGGGSPSSRSLLEEPSLSLLSRGRAALVSATADATAEDEDSSKGGATETNAGSGSEDALESVGLFGS